MKYYLDSKSPADRPEIYAFESDGSGDAFIGPHLILLDAAGLAIARAAQEKASAPTLDELRVSAHARRDSLLATAALRIAPLQYAADLNLATDAEASSLIDWKQYSVDVNRVSDQAGFPVTLDWPAPPA